MSTSLKFAVIGLAAGATALAGCGERPPMKSEQLGYRGTGQQQVNNLRLQAALRPDNLIPATPYALDPDAGGERAN